MSSEQSDLNLQDVPALQPVPSLRTQGRFFNAAFREAQLQPDGPATYAGKYQSGPLIDAFRQAIGPIHTALEAYEPPRSLPLDDWTPEHARAFHGIGSLHQERLAALARLGREVIEPALADQTIAPGVLSRPPYFQQGDGGNAIAYYARVGCMNACFRMVFGGITGWQPAERAVGRAVALSTPSFDSTRQYKTTNEHFLQVFHTPRFARRFPGRVATRSIIGADLDIIARLGRIRERNPAVQAYCIVPVGSEVNHQQQDSAHAVVLLSADKDTVTVHDPSSTNRVGRADRVLPKADFARRWAAAHNIALLVVHDPTQR
jgi:hypothetical protein